MGERFDIMRVSSFHSAMKKYALAALSSLLLAGCATTFRPSYDQPAYKPKDPSKVVVKVSLDKQMIYVMEGTAPCWSRPAVSESLPIRPRREISA